MKYNHYLSFIILICTSFVLMTLGTNYGFSFLDIVYFWKGSLEPYFEPYYNQLSVINPLIRITLILACIEAYFLYKDYKLNVIDKKITKL